MHIPIDDDDDVCAFLSLARTNSNKTQKFFWFRV